MLLTPPPVRHGVQKERGYVYIHTRIRKHKTEHFIESEHSFHIFCVNIFCVSIFVCIYFVRRTPISTRWQTQTQTQKQMRIQIDTHHNTPHHTLRYPLMFLLSHLIELEMSIRMSQSDYRYRNSRSSIRSRVRKHNHKATQMSKHNALSTTH